MDEKLLISSLGLPLIMIDPVFFRFAEISRPDKKLSRVVLPAPDAPMIARN